ncbi:MEDS domain-containing protein [Actinoplanes teichomyceticus]|uniref:DcmR-like sensory protein n=1 Tax=Actinoplanes teichomyceticus TaxID=1867 RepID=A0A561VIR8_ACTTI|nr:MEDS domain-containing protein [Actinoplanes teichomyceticus]TWG11505.1 DcmR-like sensory protein [Actinoplanes teichomyceticus]
MCLAYDDAAEFRTHAADFLTAGVAAGEHVWFVGPAGPAPIDAPGRIIDTAQAYGADLLDPAAQVAAYAAATDAALAAGYTGLRVAADVSTLLPTPAHRDAFARYEFAIGRYMLTAPFRAVCGYDRATLGDAVIAELACLHPRATAGSAPFHLYPASPRPGHVHLTGELDVTTEQLLTTALRRTEPGRPLVLHGEQLDFIDHRSLLVLDRHAEQHRTTLVLRTRSSAVRRLAELIEPAHIRVEVVA